MSIYAQFDEDGAQYQIASNRGWGEFGRWCDALDVERFPVTVALFEHGFTVDLEALSDELAAAISAHEPDADTLAVATELLSALAVNKAAAAILLITNGMKT